MLKRNAAMLFADLFAFGRFLVIYWPKSNTGTWLRCRYWRRKTGAPTLQVGRGAQLGDCRFIQLGENVEIGDNVEFDVEGPPLCHPVFMGSNVLIARGVYVRAANHRYDDLAVPIMRQGHVAKTVLHEGRPYSVVIGSDVWIGANVVILSGARIGNGCIVGAGAVVSSELPPYSVAAGNPAKVIFNRSDPGRAKAGAALAQEA